MRFLRVQSDGKFRRMSCRLNGMKRMFSFLPGENQRCERLRSTNVFCCAFTCTRTLPYLNCLIHWNRPIGDTSRMRLCMFYFFWYFNQTTHKLWDGRRRRHPCDVAVYRPGGKWKEVGRDKRQRGRLNHLSASRCATSSSEFRNMTITKTGQNNNRSLC